MASKKKGISTPAPQWWKHLRPEYKRIFWKKERKVQKEKILKEEQ